MLDSIGVLNTLHLAYSIYAIAIMLLFAWFGFRLRGGETRKLLRPGIFYAFIGLLVFAGIFIHILTFNKIPWVAMDLHRKGVVADQVVEITVKDHQFIMPTEDIVIEGGKVVKFDVTSEDLTYGFGLFRDNGTLVFQMQVVPGSPNELLWKFGKNGTYDIRSTEYSGPEGAGMLVPDAVQVIGCEVDDPFSS